MFRSSLLAAVIVLTSSAAAGAQPSLLGAANSFEALAETSFAAPDSDLDADAGRAAAAAASVRASLPPGDAGDLDAQLRRIAAAERTGDRTAVSRSAAEAYRILVSASDGSSTIPADVRLLGYARLRFKVDMTSDAPRWEDARQAADYARARWQAVAPQVATGALRVEMQQTLDDLDSASGDRDPVAADQASGDLLDLIQQLDAYFAARPSARAS